MIWPVAAKLLRAIEYKRDVDVYRSEISYETLTTKRIDVFARTIPNAKTNNNGDLSNT